MSLRKRIVAALGGALVSLLLLSSTPAQATTHVAASCSIADIHTAWTGALSGDIIQVPAGSCTWTGGLGTLPTDLTLQGAGIGQTIITLNVAGGLQFIKFSTTVSRITGFEIHITNGDQVIYARGQGFRIDHNKLVNDMAPGNSRVCVFVAGASGSGIPHPTGVIDHNNFIDCRAYVQGDLTDSPGAYPPGGTLWQEATKIGNANQDNVVYIEDNTFDRTRVFGNATDSQYSTRMVIRYNTVLNSWFEIHSADCCSRGSRSFEIYNNHLTSNNGSFTCMFLRGGTGVVYNNTCDGNYAQKLQMDNVRSYLAQGTPNFNCTGTVNISGRPLDGPLVDVGYPCRDQIGRGLDDPGAFPQPQASEPLYFWGNTANSVAITPNATNCANTIKTNGSCHDIVSGRDYINGVLSGYTAYTYPYPGISGFISAPTGFQIVP